LRKVKITVRSTVLVSIGASIVSTITTAIIFTMTLPGLVDAQVARTTAVGLTVVSASGLEGVDADLKATGGGGLIVRGGAGATLGNGCDSSIRMAMISRHRDWSAASSRRASAC
jgi:hypothetical protein